MFIRKLFHGSSDFRNFQVAAERTPKSLTILRAIKRVIWGDTLPDKATLSKELSQWIAEFQPDVVYTILGSIGMMELIEKIVMQNQLPLIVHMMDDWPTAQYRGGVFSLFLRRKMESLLNSLLHKSSVRMGICDLMSEEYEKKYGLPFVSFQNTIDAARWGELSPNTKNGREGEILLLYVGSIFPNAQLESLKECCQAVAGLKQNGWNIRFEIYSPTFLATAFRSELVIDPCISLHEAITDDTTFFAKLRSADVLVLPVNFDQATIRYIKYSMPTKVPAYLLSGTPILVYGPKDVAQVKYAHHDGWGYVVSSHGVKHVQEGIRELTHNESLRRRLSARARILAQERHDAAKVRYAFQKTLSDAA